MRINMNNVPEKGRLGNKNPNWKGGKKMYHWANISKSYKRNRNDWLRLCVPCHMKYDGLTKNK